MNELMARAAGWIDVYLFTPATLLQLGWVGVALLLGFLLARRPVRAIGARLAARPPSPWVAPLVPALIDTIFPILTVLVLLTYQPVALHQGLPDTINQASVRLGLAWVAIRFVSTLIRRPSLARTVAMTAWAVAALGITGLLGHVIRGMDAIAITLGSTRISMWMVVSGTGALVLFLGVALVLSNLVERRIEASTELSPSFRVLFAKLVRIVLLVAALLIGLNAVGVDLTALTVFSGAVGLGLGFGLQKVISNFISGIILLADRSIKPGDVIVVGDTYGWVQSLSTRYVSLVTRDGKEHLIPNETLITERVENWSHSNNYVRLRIPVGISYRNDLRLAMRLMTEAAAESPRVLPEPPPNCLLTAFGNSSVDLELRVWIDNPADGVGGVKSDVLLRVWDKFHQGGIEIPYPQVDVHLKEWPAPPPAPVPPPR
ncbi:MAG: mechanosensitive ion channel [Nitrospirae bacterium]|nr:mechanosensitive ion channel [Nitrospirota bacterium]